MSLWRHITRGLRTLRNRKAADQDLADELNHYLEESETAFTTKGLSPEEARRAARLELDGTMTAVSQQVRESGWENTLDTLFTDLRYAARRLRASPGFTAVSVLTLALGLGASTAIFSVIEGVLLKPLPYANSERLVALRHTAPGIDIKELNLSLSLFFTYKEENRVFEDVSIWSGDSWTVTGLAEPEQAAGLAVSRSFLPVLGVQPAIGRGFTKADEDPKGEATVMLSDGFWRSRFGADPSTVGRRILLDGKAHTIIGVLPASFQFMDRAISLIAPLRIERSSIWLISFCCDGVARLKPGVTLAQANSDIDRMLPLAAEKFPLNPGWRPNLFADARIAARLRPLKDVLVGDAGATLWLLMGTVGIVLSIACANVANLLLVRAAGRRQELAIRAALGAGWERIARELLLESTLLSFAGGAFELALAYAALRALAASGWAHLPRLHEISIDATVLAFAVGVALLSGLAFGLIPVFHYARPRVLAGLREGGRPLTGSKERRRARGMLVFVQVALALVLLVGAGLMIRTSWALRQVDPGFTGATELAAMRIGIPAAQVQDDEAVIRMQEALIRKMESTPGVVRAAAINNLPLEGGSNDPIDVEGQQARQPGGGIPPVRRFKSISPGYVAAIGTRMIAGREMTWAETYRAAPVVLVSENLARELWSEPNAAIGKRIRVSAKDDWREVIGVIADLRDDGIDQKAPAIVYWPMLKKNPESSSTLERSMVYVIRTPRAGSSLLRQEIQQAVASVNPALPLADVKTMQTVYEGSLARTSLTPLLLMTAGTMALLLGVVGIYGVISYAVSQRTREIGIRIALGAPLEGVTGLFVREGLLLSGAGAVCGLALAFGLARLMQSILFEVSPVDPLTYAVASGTLILAAVTASYLPARRAARVDPVETLRSE